MSEMENVQPQEERVEGGEQVESTERAEEQAVQDATHEPGARVEQTQNYEQAEAVESAVTEAVDNVEQAEAKPAPQSVETVTEVDVAQEVGTVDRDDHEMIDGESLREASEDEDDDTEAATPINVPAPEQVDVETQERLATQEGDDGEGRQDATPIVIPDVAAEASDDQVGMEFDPVPEPPPEGQVARDAGTGGSVAEVPEPGGTPPGPNQVAELDTVDTQAASGQADQPGGGVAATPINLPGTADVALPPEPVPDPPDPGNVVQGAETANQVESGAGGRPGGDVAATPINLPREANVIDGAQGEQVAHVDHWSEVPEPGDDPPPPNLEADTYVETGDRLSEDAELEAAPWIRVADDGSELMQEMEVPLEAETEEEVPQEGESLDTPPQESAEEGEAEEGVPSEVEEQKDAPNWYLHEDSEGNVTVVDENGKPVDSPPKIVYFKGKYYAVYPGDDLPVKEDGSVTDPQKLAEYEISAYKPSTEGMKVYSGKDGTTVVDENGNPVESPPAVIQDPATGKYYFVTETDPAKLCSFNKSGNFKDALAQGLIKEAPGYQPSTEEMKVYSGKDGTTVVDENGNPVESPPAVVQDPKTGKYYFVTESDPAKLSSFAKSGNFKDALAQGLIQEAPSYQPSTEGMKVYSSKDGTTVVDENGKPVESPPAVVQDPKTGKYYFVTESDPAKLSSFTKSGNFQDALAQGLIQEAPSYQPSTDGMKVYSGKDGTTVVDENGKPVESPPAVVQDPKTGKYYFVTETDSAKLSSFTKSGNFKDALAQGLIKEASAYQPSTEGMKIYPDKDGNATVVDENGKPVESPPAVIQDPATGKYYFVTETDPAKLSSFTKSGNFKDALAQGLIKEASTYQPSWWGKKSV